LGGVYPFSGLGDGSPSNTKSPGPRPTSMPSGILVHSAFGHNGYWPKIGGCAPLGEGSGVPSNTMSPRLRPTSIPSGILIHTAVWPQQTWTENCGAVPFIYFFLGGGAGSPCNTISSGPMSRWNFGRLGLRLAHLHTWRGGSI